MLAIGLPCFAVYFGDDCFPHRAEDSKVAREAAREVILKALEADAALRQSSADVTSSFNTSDFSSAQVYAGMIRHRRMFNAALATLRVGRLQAIAVLNSMAGTLRTRSLPQQFTTWIDYSSLPKIW